MEGKKAIVSKVIGASTLRFFRFERGELAPSVAMRERSESRRAIRGWEFGTSCTERAEEEGEGEKI